MTKKPQAGQTRPEQHCPICGRPRDPRYRPFCSARCRDRDLLNWLSDHYVIPVHDGERDEEESVPER